MKRKTIRLTVPMEPRSATGKEDKTVLVTGASRGIGRAIVETFAGAQGYTVFGPTRQEMDLSSRQSIDRYVAAIPGIDILINNAGVNVLGAVDEVTDEVYDQMMAVNLDAPIRLIGRLVPHMKAQHFGRVLNISSIWGVRSKEYRAVYSMGKFGLNGLTRALARELGPYNILVNSVCPGYVNTEMTRQNVPEVDRERIEATIPLRRFAEPAEVAALVKFLASDENTYITGQMIVIDGGFLA